MKTKIIKKLTIMIIVSIFSVFSFSACSNNKNINISTNDISSILVVNWETLTTKNVIDNNNDDFTIILDFLNSLKKSDNNANNEIGELNINTLENSISLTVYDNGIMIEDVLYSTDNFNYTDFFNKLSPESITIQR